MHSPLSVPLASIASLHSSPSLPPPPPPPPRRLSPSTLETTFDGSVTTEISGRSLLGLGSRPAPMSWRMGQSSPRLQAGDAPSLSNSYGRGGTGGQGRFLYPGGALRRQLAARGSALCSLELSDRADELELSGLAMDVTGYMSDGDVLSKNTRPDDVTSG